MPSTRGNSITQKLRWVCTALAVLLLCTSAFPKIAVATASKGVINPLAFPSPLLPVLIVFNIVSEKICFK